MKPVIREIDFKGRTPLQIFECAPSSWERLAFLASDGTPDSRWSILAWDPTNTVGTTHDLSAQIDSRRIDEVRTGRDLSLHDLPFIGGGIGTMNYEGEFEWSFYDSALVYDHHGKQWWGIGDVVIPTEKDHRRAEESLTLKPSWDFQRYQHAFDIIHDHIRRGEIYQACLTFPFTGPASANPRGLFASLIRKHPAPMAAYLEQSDRTVMSLSPERFISWDGTTLETRPIKGTRPRGKMKEEDEGMRNELLSDEKEQAELTMITDLLRNDLAKISKPGTVKVVEERGVQKTPNVWHTYSQIRSQTRLDIGPLDIIQAMFPGGSISGCPKIRAMEILKEVETGPRGIYTGCIGYLSDHGRMDLSIAIRTLEQNSEGLKAGFGSGIVYNSQAQAEYDECFAKASIFSSP